MKIAKGTIIRTVLLILAIINNVLALFGKSPLPIADEQLKLVISTVFDMVIAVINWWKNNSFTKAAIQGDQLVRSIKNNEDYTDKGFTRETLDELTNGKGKDNE